MACPKIFILYGVVFDIYNAGPNNLDIFPNEKLCQLILERCEGKAEYKGKFKEQKL